MTNGGDQSGRDACLLYLFGSGVQVVAFEPVDHFAEANVARVGVDAAAATGEDVVFVGCADGTAVAGGDFGTGGAVVFRHDVCTCAGG